MGFAISMAVTIGFLVVGYFFLLPQLQGLFGGNITGEDEGSWGEYSIPKYPGAIGSNISEGYLMPTGANANCYLVTDSSDNILGWYSGQMSDWTVENTDNLALASINYDYICWRKESAGAMVYTIDMAGQTTLFTAVGPWSAFENYKPDFATIEG